MRPRKKKIAVVITVWLIVIVLAACVIKLLSFGESSPVPSEKNGIAEPVCDMVIADVAGFTEGAEQ